MAYLVIVERGSNSLGAYVPDLPGCAVEGEAREETFDLIRQAIQIHLDGLREAGDPIPEPVSSTELVRV